MKKLFIALSLTLAAQGSFADMGPRLDISSTKAVTAVVLLPIVPFAFSYECATGQLDKAACIHIAVTGILLSSVTLAKEVEEVKADAAEYASTKEASLQLKSVVEMIQEETTKQLGEEVSFDEVVDAINIQ